MSRYRHCEVSCDVQISRDCWETGPVERTIALAVSAARKTGWYIGPSGAEKDACPACRKEQNR